MMSRGFSLLEVMIALAISAFGIVAAAQFARSATRQTRFENEVNQLSSEARVLATQLREDLRVTGLGSTGAIGVDPASAPWTQIAISNAGLSTALTTGSPFPSIPAVSGADNAPLVGSGTWASVPNTDMLMLVVPDPSTLVQTQDLSPRGSNALATLNRMTCPNSMVYVTDHSAANSAGRTQIANNVNGAGIGPTTLNDLLQFDVAAFSDVMCARVSLYWVGIDTSQPAPQTPWLLRSDLSSSAGPYTNVVGGSGGGGPGVLLDQSSPPQAIAPGVWDFEVAYRLSPAAPDNSIPSLRIGAPNPLQQWVFDAAGLGPANLSLGPDWFEVRQVRFSMYVGTLRTLRDTRSNATTISEPGLENRVPNVAIPIGAGRYQLTTAEVLTNLRFFDKNVPSGILAEPY
jgi:prepilin-type N-terminal cleavage/methylation domain-containing protein